MSQDTFMCHNCGQCCRHIALFGTMYSWLLNAEGQCRYFDAEANKCTIYELRPVICRVEEGYLIHFSHIPYNEYVRRTKEVCSKLIGIK